MMDDGPSKPLPSLPSSSAPKRTKLLTDAAAAQALLVPVELEDNMMSGSTDDEDQNEGGRYITTSMTIDSLGVTLRDDNAILSMSAPSIPASGQFAPVAAVTMTTSSTVELKGDEEWSDIAVMRDRQSQVSQFVTKLNDFIAKRITGGGFPVNAETLRRFVIALGSDYLILLYLHKNLSLICTSFRCF
jgi:hypothetical protein